MAAAAILNFGKKSITLHWIKISCLKLYGKMHNGDADDHVTKSQNRKLILVTSSYEVLKHMCIELSDYNRYLNKIWHRTQIPHDQHAEMPKFILTENPSLDGSGRHLEFQRNVNNSGLDTDIHTKFYGKMHHGHAGMTS